VCNAFRDSDTNMNPRQQRRDRLNWRFHPQACYTSRLLNFANLPEPTNFFTRYRTHSPSSSQIDLEQLRTPSMALSDPIYTSLLRKHYRADKIFFKESEICSDNESTYSQEILSDDVTSLRYSKAITTELERRSTPDVGGRTSRYSLALEAELQRCTTPEGRNKKQRKGKKHIPAIGSTFNDTRNIAVHNKRQNDLRKNIYNRYDQNASNKARKEMAQTYKYSIESIKETGIKSPPKLLGEHLFQDDDDAYQNYVLQFVRRQPTIQRARKEKTTSIFVSKFDHQTDSTPPPPIR
ncbi:17121_t:CDS:2, partial [Racocetra persica]